MSIPAELRALAESTNGLLVLVLHGSRARGDAHDGSDWDFGFLAQPDCDLVGLSVALGEALDTDAIDLVDLSRASGLLRYRVALEGTLVFERSAHAYEAFVLDALRFWFDAGPAIVEAQETVLERLG